MKSDTTAGLELRVLGGAQTGARANLGPDLACRIVGGRATGWTAAPEGPDLVLQSVDGFALRLAPADRADVVMLTVLEGAARLGEAQVPLGQPVRWRLREPLNVGDVVLAVGPGDEPHWTVPAPEPMAPETSARSRPRAGAERWLVPMGVALVSLCVGLLGLVELMSPVQASMGAASHGDLAAALQASEFRSLHLDQSPQGQVRLTGKLNSTTQRERLQAWLAQRGVSAVLQVQVDDHLAEAVAEVFRLHGLSAKAEAQGDGRVLVRAQERDTWRLARAEQAARRDVAGLQGVEVVNTPPAEAPGPRPPLSPDAGKRIVSVIEDTETPYFVTADGGRYFIGALLPSGHRVLQIADQVVTVERDGQLTRLTL